MDIQWYGQSEVLLRLLKGGVADRAEVALEAEAALTDNAELRELQAELEVDAQQTQQVRVRFARGAMLTPVVVCSPEWSTAHRWTRRLRRRRRMRLRLSQRKR